MRFHALYHDPAIALYVVGLALFGLIVRGIIYLVDRRTEPDIMKRRINDGSDRFFRREEALGDPMVNQLTGNRLPQYLESDFEERMKRDLGK